MPPIGPTLPPNLTKRGRDDLNDRGASPEANDKRRRVLGPAPPPPVTSSPRRIVGPSLPPQSGSRSSSPDSNIGPAPPQPPAPLGKRPPNPPQDNDDSESSDDDFGPSLPPAHRDYLDNDTVRPPLAKSVFDTDPHFTEAPKKAQRDEWMTLPPTQDDLAARMDPTKQRARKFNSGKSAPGSGAMGSAWTETPEQKLKRLQNEALGIAAPSKAPVVTSREEERRARKIKDKIDAARGKSLVEQHKEKGEGKEKEDDPSKRAFNYEKDMAISGSVNHKQRREMLNKSKGFSDRFSSGTFL